MKWFKPSDYIPEERWTVGMRVIAEFAKKVAWVTLERTLTVNFVSAPHLSAASCSPSGVLTFNKAHLGQQAITERVVELIIHEIAHLKYANHNEDYYNELTKIGARLYVASKEGKI